MSNPSSTGNVFVHSSAVIRVPRSAVRNGGAMRIKDAVGRFGEDVVAAHLQDAGWTVLARNWRCREGELDLIGAEDGVLVVVEVKTRSSASFGRPVEAVRPVKAARLRRLAMRWLAEDGRYWPEVRFDVIGVLRVPGAAPTIEHVRSAF